MPRACVPVQVALQVAYRHYQDADTSEAERDAILQAICEIHDGREAEAADRVLHHRREAAKQQLQLKALIEGVGGES